MHQPLPPSLLIDDENGNEKSDLSNANTATLSATGILERLSGLGRRKTIARREREPTKEQVNLGVTNGQELMKDGRNRAQFQAGHSGAEDISKTSTISNGTNGKIEGDYTTALQTSNPLKNTTAENYISRILSIHNRLSAFASLKPSPELNALFGELVGLAIETLPVTLTYQIMNDSRILSILHSLRTLCGNAECELESHWAKLITSLSPTTTSLETGKDTYNALKQFPYFQNYVDLARMEIHALHSILEEGSTNRLEKVAFIGSGPLPLTSLCLLWQPHTTIQTILNIDSNPEAIAQSSLICNKLGFKKYAKGMEFACESATDPNRDLRGFDVVFLAALVGGTQEEKAQVLRGVVGRMRKGGVVVVRSSHGLRGLLYPEFEFTTPGVQEVLEVVVECRPWGGVVNSVVVGRVV